MGRFILRRLKEPSTWAGIVTVVTALFGWELDGGQRDAVVQAGVAIVGVLLVFARESGDVREREAAEIRKQIEQAGRAVYGDPAGDERVRPGERPAPPLPPDGKNRANPDDRHAGQRRRGFPFGRRDV